MINVITVEGRSGVLGRIEVGLSRIRCARCQPGGATLEAPDGMESANALGAALTALVEHLDVAHDELADSDDDGSAILLDTAWGTSRETDDAPDAVDEAEHATLWAAAYDRLRRSDPAP